MTMTETAGPRTPAGLDIIQDAESEAYVEHIVRIEREAVTLALTELRREVEAMRGVGGVMYWHGSVDRTEVLALIDKAVPR
jgi:hypothetical protein